MSQKQPQESRLPRPPTYPPMPPIATHRRDAEQATRIAELERVQGVLVGALGGLLRDVQEPTV